jgi:predicted SAM-dependent methyltransferase
MGVAMKREDEILKFVDKSALGIEVAPYFRPLLPKSEGNNVLIIDIFDQAHLRKMAADDPHLLPEWVDNIESVDIVGDASSLGDYAVSRGISGKIAHIVSSHNFEHLPNPIKFLQGCSQTLKVGGILSMAVPDCRACFDHFRTPTRLADWLNALHNNSVKPDAATLFDCFANNGAYLQAGKNTVGCDIKTGDLNNFILTGDVKNSYADFLTRKNSDFEYIDAHCTVMFPETLELMLRDCFQLDLIDLEIVEISQTQGLEFFVHLRKAAPETKVKDKNYQNTRQDLMRKINSNIGSSPFTMRKSEDRLKSMATTSTLRFKAGLRSVFGDRTYENVRGRIKQVQKKLKS